MEAIEKRLGGAQSGGKARRNSRGGRGGGHLLLNARGEFAQGFRVLSGTTPDLLERVLGAIEVLLDATDAVERRNRLGDGRRRKLHGLPHAVGHAAVHPSSRLLARGRGQGDDRSGRAWARLGDEESPYQQTGQGPRGRTGLGGGTGVSGVGACAEWASAHLDVAVCCHLLEEVVGAGCRYPVESIEAPE